MLYSSEWTDYALIDAAHGEKLERWGSYVLRRPDPQAIWQEESDPTAWRKVDAFYHRSNSGGGKWEYFERLPEMWDISYKNLKFNVRPTGFKHTGLFPEQAVNWDFVRTAIESRSEKMNVLNLFAYTGGATVAAASAGADVVHVDAAKGMVSWAKDNAASSGLGDAYIRYIVDDCLKFVEREIRRGRKYDGIIMDPPSYGRGPKGEIWKFEDELYRLVTRCAQLLSDKPLFFIINSYTTGISHTVVANVTELTVGRRFKGKIVSDEIGIPMGKSGMFLPCGATTRWFDI